MNLNICTYNLHLCQTPFQLIDNIRKLLMTESIDIFCFQEVVRDLDRDFFTDELLKELGKEWKSICHVGKEKSWHSIGNCIVWNSRKLQLQNSKNIILPPTNKGLSLKESVFSRLIAGGVYQFKRRSLIAEFKTKSGVFQIANIHLDNIGGPDHRDKQIKYVLSKINSNILSTIVCGDFNTFDLDKSGSEQSSIKIAFGPDYSDMSFDSGWTGDLHRVNFSKANRLFAFTIKKFNIHIKKKLDYIWAKGFEKKFVKKIDLVGSDHIPLISSIKF